MASFFDLSSLGLTTSQGQLLAAWLMQMQTTFPSYAPSAGNPEYIQAQTFFSGFADVANLCAAGSTELFRQYGQKLIGLPLQAGSSASAVATVTAVDTLGHTLGVGSQLTLTLNGAQLAFQTASTLTIANGQSSGTVTVVAVQTGAAFNGAGNPVQLVQQTTWVSSVAVAAAASGGADQETDDAYLQRLANTLTTLAPRPITASDYATLALNFVPAAGTDQQEVGRATAIDGYDPGANTFGNQREVSVCITDAVGQALNADTLVAVQAFLANLREVNFIVNVVSPNYTTIYVAATVKAATGYTAATVQANVQAALLAYLNPQNFGLPSGAQVGWQNQTTVPLSRVAAVIQNAGGVQQIVAGTMAVDTNSHPTNTTNDLVLGGPFPLPVTTTASIPTAAFTVV